jgi:hypothetical protein
LCAFFICTQGCGRSERPAFPAPSLWRAGHSKQTSDASRRENEKLCLNVIASEAKQSMLRQSR